MKTFYIFKIKKDYMNIYVNSPKNLYIMLKCVYNYKYKDINPAINLFNEICLPININFFNNYLFNKLKNDESYSIFRNIHMYNNYLTDEVSKLNINNTYMLLKSNKEDNIFLNNIEDLTDLFVCNFVYDYYISKNNPIIKEKS